MNESISSREVESMIEAHLPMLRTYVRVLANNDRHLMEDLVQETLLAAWKSLDTLSSLERFGPWLRGIARNKVREQRRTMSRRPLDFDSTIVEGMEQVYSMFDQPADGGETWQDRLDVVQECMAGLRQEMKDMLSHFYDFGRTLDETARLTGATRLAVAQRLSRARDLIRLCVKKKQGHETDG